MWAPMWTKNSHRKRNIHTRWSYKYISKAILTMNKLVNIYSHGGFAYSVLEGKQSMVGAPQLWSDLEKEIASGPSRFFPFLWNIHSLIHPTNGRTSTAYLKNQIESLPSCAHEARGGGRGGGQWDSQQTMTVNIKMSQESWLLSKGGRRRPDWDLRPHRPGP